MNTNNESAGLRKIAAIATVFFPISHADVILSRWNKPFAGDGDWGWQGGASEIVSLYVAQHPQNTPDNKDDVSDKFSSDQGVPLVENIEQALTLGGETLAVDGVLLIGEHGDFPTNERGQKLYPRKELFDEIVAVFRKTGKTVPVFCDKHLSWNPQWAVEMVETAREMGFPLMAGSTTPYCGTVPELSLSSTDEVEQALGVYYGGEEVYGFHSLEFVQHFLESRAGGEPGVKRITAWRGKEIEEGLDDLARELIQAALAVAQEPITDLGSPWLEDDRERFVLYRFEHYDGLVSRHLMLNGIVRAWIAAIKVKGEVGIRAARANMGEADSYYGHFATLNSLVDKMFITGKEPVSLERTLLTTRMLAHATEALMQPGVPLDVDIATGTAKLIHQ